MKKKILMLLCAICFVLPIALMFTGCNNKPESYNIKFDYGKATSFFETNTTSVSVNANEWITTIPNIKDEYKDSFLGWFVQGSDTEIKNNSFIGADCTLEARFDINEAPSGLYQNGKYVMTWEELNWPQKIHRDYWVGDLVVDSSVTMLKVFEFKDFNKLNSVILPDSIENIGASAFENCTSLQSVRMPKNVHDIKNGTFKGCSSLKSFVIDKNITKVSGGAFAGCLNLDTVTVCGNVKVDDGNYEYGYNVFKGCTSLNSVTIDEGVSYLDRILNGCSNIVTVNLPLSLQSISLEAFENCSSLRELYIPANVSFIGANIFKGCDSLTDIFVNNEFYFEIDDMIIEKESGYIVSAIPKSILNFFEHKELNQNLTIGSYAFAGCKELENINYLGNPITSIGAYAFENCVNLTEITIQSNVTYIGTNAFYGCNALESIDLHTTQETKWELVYGNEFAEGVDISTIDNETLISYLTTENGYFLRQVEK